MLLQHIDNYGRVKFYSTGPSGLYYKHITIVNDDHKWCHNSERHPRLVIYDHSMYIESLIKIVNYDHNTFIVQATEATILNYNCNMFTVQAPGWLFFTTKKCKLL